MGLPDWADGLSERQVRFVEAYLIEPNATQAAITAGYSKNGAEVQGNRLLRNAKVSQAIAKARTKRTERARKTADDVLRELERIAFMDFRDLASWDESGIRFKPSEELSDDAAATLKSLESKRETKRYGKPGEQTETETLTLKVKRWDKVAALKLLGEHHGLFSRKDDDKPTEQTGGLIVTPVKDLSALSADELRAEYDKRARGET